MKRSATKFVRPVFGCVVIAAALAGPLCAAEPRGKIAADGVGTVSVRPDVAEIRTSVSGNASLAAEAVKKFRDNRRRACELLHKLDLKGLVIDGRGPVISSNAANNGQQNAAFIFNAGVVQANQQSTGINCVEQLVVRVPSIDRMKDDEVVNAVVKVLDACKDAGMTIACVHFKSTNMETKKTAAVRAAVAAARQKAELLASLSAARVGAVLAIQETAAPANPFENGIQQAGVDSDENITVNGMNIQVSNSSPLTPIVVRASVNVEFALERGK
jgi:uncharacterized protein YggE